MSGLEVQAAFSEYNKMHEDDNSIDRKITSFSEDEILAIAEKISLDPYHIEESIKLLA